MGTSVRHATLAHGPFASQGAAHSHISRSTAELPPFDRLCRGAGSHNLAAREPRTE